MRYEHHQCAKDRTWEALIASELRSISVALDLLGERLCADSAVASAHLDQLQQLDRLSQEQRSLADLIEAEDRDDAAQAIPLAELMARLQSNRPSALVRN